MIEALIVLGLLGALATVGWAAVLVSWPVIAISGAVCSAVGLLLGVPTGFYYHVMLYRCLGPRGLLPARWWWSPVRLHQHLSEAERSRVLPWFYAGGAGFLLIVVGAGLTLLGVLLAK
jgi:hypothetical protein